MSEKRLIEWDGFYRFITSVERPTSYTSSETNQLRKMAGKYWDGLPKPTLADVIGERKLDSMNYTTSKDYEKLWNLVQEGKEIVCFLEGLSTYVTIARKNGEYSDVLSAGVLGVAARTKIDFINQCENIHLEFLPPDAWIKIESDKDLPPDGQSVECVFRGKEVSHASWDKCLNKWDNGDYYWAKEDITHWKPLPEAPKQAEKDGER